MNSCSTPLASADPDVFAAVQAEQRRQTDGLELIASENYASAAVLQAPDDLALAARIRGQIAEFARHFPVPGLA